MFWRFPLFKNFCGKNSPCRHNAICQSGFTDKGYRCLCNPGFQGEHCEGKHVYVVELSCSVCIVEISALFLFHGFMNQARHARCTNHYWTFFYCGRIFSSSKFLIFFFLLVGIHPTFCFFVLKCFSYLNLYILVAYLRIFLC